MKLPTFYRGFLYALCEEVAEDPFEAEGDRFHEAFRAALEYAASEKLTGVPAEEILENFDPVFGVSPEATEMLLEGERDFIVSLLNPRLQLAQFKISPAVATKELEGFPEREAFRRVAKRFHSQLGWTHALGEPAAPKGDLRKASPSSAPAVLRPPIDGGDDDATT